MKFNFKFDLEKSNSSGPRAGRITTPNGTVETPIFMPVGTAGAMKAMTPAQLEACGAQIMLSNTYHLHSQPGEDIVRKHGGLHAFTGWKKVILTDSGGFQVYSLPNKEIDDEGVSFRVKKSGETIRLTPEKSMEIQNQLGADIIMAFDQCVEYPADKRKVEAALARTTNWAKRCREYHGNPAQALFGIVQGGTYDDLRRRSAEELAPLDFPGYAVGGLSVGEGLDIMKRILECVLPLLPEEKPRYVMGIGLPEDIVEAVDRGADMFDCVIPTKYARSAVAFTHFGRMRLTASKFRKDLFPIDVNCACYACKNFTRSYLHHLFTGNEVLSATLVSIHNVHFYLELVGMMREAILKSEFPKFKRKFYEKYRSRN